MVGRCLPWRATNRILSHSAWMQSEAIEITRILSGKRQGVLRGIPMIQMSAKKQAKRIMKFSKDRFIFAVTRCDYAVHFWCENVIDTPSSFGGINSPRAIGGIEYHWPKMQQWSKPDPDHKRCWITNLPCWHDGSSLQAEETYIPMFRMCNEDGNFEPLWCRLERCLDEIIRDDQ